MISRAIVFTVFLMMTATTSLAQQKQPIGPWVADVRLSSAGLPGEPGWTPAVPAETVTPSRGLGIEFGAHVNVIRRRAFALGIGATYLVARGASTPAEVSDTAPAVVTIPDVSTRVTSLAPQISLNFGHSLGWSYVSVGLGRSRVESEAVLTGLSFTPRDSDWVKTLNYGGGARWMLSEHLGVGFDVRWHKLSLVTATATRPGAPRASLLVAGVGIVVK